MSFGSAQALPMHAIDFARRVAWSRAKRVDARD
jgi:hypothetical protein